MKKIKIVFLMLLFLTVITASSQEGQGERRRGEGRGEGRGRSVSPSNAEAPDKISIWIINETGFIVKAAFVRKANENSWGDNLLDDLLHKGERAAVSIDSFDRDSTYNIRVQDEEGDFYTKYDVKLRERGTVRMEIGDFEWQR